MNSSATNCHVYVQRARVLQQQLEARTRLSAWLNRSRGALFLASLVPAIIGWTESGPRGLMYGLAGLLFATFVAVVTYHEQVLESVEVLRLRLRINQQQAARIRRDWSGVDRQIAVVPPENEQIVRDLDLTGDRSLFQLICRAYTPIGRARLLEWLLQFASPDEVRARQDAVRWLSPQNEFREELELRGRQLTASAGGPAAFVTWASGPQWLARRPWVKWLSRVLPVAIIGLTILVLSSAVVPEWALAVYLLIGASVVFNVIYVGTVHDIFNQITSGKNELVHYAALFDSVSQLPTDVAKLASLKSLLGHDSRAFRTALRKLKRLAKLGSGRSSSLFGMFYVVAQIVLLWDFHVLHRLEDWQAKHGHHLQDWFEAVGQLEALSSLASLAHDYVEWTYPEIDDSNEVHASRIGHPLLEDSVCIRNDAQVGPAGTFLLVTGSNMSGKSTFLRALGVNIVLAGAGSPVCAKMMRLPVLEVATSMRVSDSLADGVSFFLAELQRLKQIVTRAKQLEGEGDSPLLLFLLDEILQGTNSAERHVAVEHVIASLLESNTIGAVSTHDLELAKSPVLHPHGRAVHFRETIESTGDEDTMTFDYRLRAGVSPTTNALKLLEMVGLAERHQARD